MENKDNLNIFLEIPENFEIVETPEIPPAKRPIS